MQVVKTLPASIKEKRIPRAEAPRIPFIKGSKKKSMGIRRLASKSACLILVMRVEKKRKREKKSLRRPQES
eukprot:1113436-Pelagomonas_calceolata.AAC.1